MITLIPKDPEKTFDITHPDGAVFTCRHWTVGMQDEIDRRCVQINPNGTIQYNTPLERELKIDMSIVGWTGIKDDNEDAAPCTPENKKQLPVGIIIWLQRELDERAGLRITQEEKKS